MGRKTEDKRYFFSFRYFLRLDDPSYVMSRESTLKQLGHLGFPSILHKKVVIFSGFYRTSECPLFIGTILLVYKYVSERLVVIRKSSFF